MKAYAATSVRSLGPATLACLLLVCTVGLHWAPAQSHGTGANLTSAHERRGVPFASSPYANGELPARADLSPKLPPPGDQGRQNSCVGWTLAYALKSYQESVEQGVSSVDHQGRLQANRVFSPAFLYNQINDGRDEGASVIQALRLMEEQGVATLGDMPYDPSDYRTQPTATARANARRYRIDYWRQVNTASPKEVKAQLAAGYPVIAAARLDRTFLQAGPGFVWRRWVAAEGAGAHAFLIVGYDDARHAFRFLNSWGRDWGDGGYGWVDYDHFVRVANEAYVAKDAITGGADRGVVADDSRGPFGDRPEVPFEAEASVMGGVEATAMLPRGDRPQFGVARVQHDARWPGRDDLGAFLRFDGNLVIPPGAGRTNRSVIYFYRDDGRGGKGVPVRATMAYYSDVNGNVACGTAVYPIPPEGTRTTWAAWIPYAALDVPAGRQVQTAAGHRYQPADTALIAEPVLFIDDFGVLSGGLFRFTVRR